MPINIRLILVFNNSIILLYGIIAPSQSSSCIGLISLIILAAIMVGAIELIFSCIDPIGGFIVDNNLIMKLTISHTGMFQGYRCKIMLRLQNMAVCM